MRCPAQPAAGQNDDDLAEVDFEQGSAPVDDHPQALDLLPRGGDPVPPVHDREPAPVGGEHGAQCEVPHRQHQHQQQQRARNQQQSASWVGNGGSCKHQGCQRHRQQGCRSGGGSLHAVQVLTCTRPRRTTDRAHRRMC